LFLKETRPSILNVDKWDGMNVEKVALLGMDILDKNKGLFCSIVNH
jgi:hypothetical protein